MRFVSKMITTELGDEYAAVPVVDGQGFHGIVRMNKTAYEIWKELEKGLDKESIAALLVEKYEGINYEQAEESVIRVLRKLRDEGIIEECF